MAVKIQKQLKTVETVKRAWWE